MNSSVSSIRNLQKKVHHTLQRPIDISKKPCKYTSELQQLAEQLPKFDPIGELAAKNEQEGAKLLADILKKIHKI